MPLVMSWTGKRWNDSMSRTACRWPMASGRLGRVACDQQFACGQREPCDVRRHHRRRRRAFQRDLDERGLTGPHEHVLVARRDEAREPAAVHDDVVGPPERHDRKI